MNIFILLIISFLILSVFGTLLHFTHGWLKKGFLLHIFSALNESSWEHMKMLVAPTLLVMVIQYFALEARYTNLFNSFLIFFLVELVSMPLLFELLKYLFKNKVPLVFTIVLFYICILLGLLSEYLFLQNGVFVMSELMAKIGIVVVTASFIVFSYFPPHFPILKDPVNGGYGHL